MKKGIVMDINDDYITMLTPDGEFIKSRHTKASYEIGEEIQFFPLQERKSSASRTHIFQRQKVRFTFISSLVAIILLSILIPLTSENEVYAYMSIDINPSFEVGLDDETRVVSLEALNDDAKKLLVSLPEWKNKSISFVTKAIINKSRDNGYITNEGQVLITTVVNDSHKVEVDRDIQENIEKIQDEYEEEQIAITSINSTAETRNKAREKGVSTGKLLLLEDKVPTKKKDNKKAKTAPSTNENQSKNENQDNNKNVDKKQNDKKNEKKRDRKEQNDNDKKNNGNKDEPKKKGNENSSENQSYMPDPVKEKVQKKTDEKNERKQDKNDKYDNKQENREKNEGKNGNKE